MNRLTKRNSDGTVSQPLNLCWADALEKLACYEDLEEAGRLVVLPCKVGDVLWTYANYPCEYIYPFEVRGIRPIEKEITTDKVGTVKWDDIGRTVFLTREAAEAAMKEVTR